MKYSPNYFLNKFNKDLKVAKKRLNLSILTKEQKSEMVFQIFHSVSKKYDITNDIMSFGMHRYWKKIIVNYSGARQGQTILDLAGGTGDIAEKLSLLVGKKGKVFLVDINKSMLRIGRNKLRDKGIIGNIEYIQANAEELPFLDNTFDCITTSFGLRNFSNQEQALSDIYRTLKPGGRFLVLEFSKPIFSLIKKIYDVYSFYILPFIGECFAKDIESYRYLVESIRIHPDQEQLKKMMQHSNFFDVNYVNLSAGIVAIHRGYKF